MNIGRFATANALGEQTSEHAVFNINKYINLFSSMCVDVNKDITSSG